jgi:transposase-like protein
MFAYGAALSFDVLHTIAHAAGLSPTLAWLWPLGFETFMAVAAVAVLAEQRARPHKTPWYPWVLTALAAGSSIALNFGHPEPSRVGCRFLVMKDGDMPKTYDPEFKARAVRLVRDHLADYGSVTAASFAVGAQLGVSRETLRRWVAQAEVDDGARPGLTTAEADELRRLRAENKRLREANEILKAASIFFAGELDSRNR